MNIHSSPLNARPNKWALLKCQTSAFRPRLSTSARKVVRTVCSNNLDPWKTLGVSYNADEKQIKKAYRKLALDNHPDLRGSEAAARFVKIQEAYEVVTGKRRGATADSARKSSTAAAGWDFHDWYWKFTAGKRWDAQRSKGPHSPAAEAARPRPTGAPEEALRAQLAGLRRKAAFRARSRPSASYQQSGESSASDVHNGEAASTGFQSSSEQPESSFVGHDEFPESQLAGLKRQARNRQQQQQATSDPQTLYQTVNAAAAEMEGVQASVTGKQSDQVRAVAAAAGSETRADAQAPAAEAAGAAVGESVLKCARDFMAEVRARSTSSNIVAATFTGLRAHLAPTIAHLAHLSSAGGNSATVPESDPSITAKSGTCVKTSTFQYSASEAGSGEAWGQRAVAEDGCGGRRQSAQADSAQIRRELACQLAGLKRRAAIRQYPA